MTDTTRTTTATCPECGKTVKATGLGTHRRRAHGITGQSQRAPRGARRSPVAVVGGAGPVTVALDALRAERDRIDQAIAALEALERTP